MANCSKIQSRKIIIKRLIKHLRWIRKLKKNMREFFDSDRNGKTVDLRLVDYGRECLFFIYDTPCFYDHYIDMNNYPYINELIHFVKYIQCLENKNETN